MKKFEALWAEGVDLSEAYVDTLRTKTWLSDRVTPYEVYLKFLYEYFREDINVDEEADFNLPPGFMNSAYQRQAVVSAKKVLEAYGGVFLADVVGLGKTFISALLLQQLPGRKLIVCPPVLMNYWRETLNQFYVPGFEVVSLGKLSEVKERGTDKYRVVLVDEAHRFRNELTKGYEDLHAICRGKQVILVSATPLNNKLDDILAQLKLFQPGKKSSVPGVPNLEHFFREQQRHLDGFDKSDPAYLDAVKETAARVRDKVLKHVMVRRTRTEVRRYFSEDLERQGLTFPKLGEPQRIVYRFDEETNEVFNRTVELLRAFSYARYTPLLYLQAALSDFEQQSQRNIGGFMKGLLVKRLESSFFAFKNTLRRFIGSYERFITMLAGGVVYISKDVDVFELLEAEDEVKLQRLVEEERAQRYDSSRFKPELQGALERDLELLKTMLGMWESVTRDPKLEGFIHDLQTNPLLKGRKLVIFSESKETAEYLADGLESHFPSKVMRYASGGGSWNGEGYGVRAARDLIETNYDPRAETQKDDVQLLMTTDVLAEGINLHRSNVVVNYDLPWNPTRVLQRVGRVNRVGTAHNEVYVFNFFPTAEADAHLGLEENIKAKLQAFHNTLGEDAKYLSSDEEISTHELFGDRLYQKLSDKETYEGGAEIAGEDESELKYLQVIRGVRDDAPDVSEKIKRLPKKARSGRDAPTTKAPESLVTFSRSGKLKRFALAYPDEAHELTFLEAAKRFECTSETSKVSIPPSYYELLEANKRHLETLEAPSPMTATRGGGSSNETFVLRAIKAREVRHFKGFTDDDERYSQLVREALQAGQIPKNTVKTLRTALKGNLEPLFYEALASDRGEASYYSRFECRIPLLNGGLFEPVGGYNWQETRINLRNETFEQIFSTFDLYNFTVREDEPLDKEDEPLDKEVAVDPEMLGKVFENLLDVTDRKSKGAFCTPREIVHYMCQESLINYLDTALNTVTRPMAQQTPTQDDMFGRPQTKQAPLTEDVYEESIPRADIEAFIRLGDAAQEHDATTTQKGRETDAYRFRTPESVRRSAGAINAALASIKICDPAIGSGAFPVGMMNEIVRTCLALSAHLDGAGRSAYDFKRHAIQESIYGVDIEESAVDIAKLRLWLSLIVDEDDFGTIKPLPNLRYKIVEGNSVLSLEGAITDEREMRELEALKRSYFGETRSSKKHELDGRIQQTISNIFRSAQDFGSKANFDFRVHFSEVFRPQRRTPQAFHLTWVTHNSRVSERMVTFGVKRGEPVLLSELQEQDLTRHLGEIVAEDKLKVLAYAICRDHVHTVLVCEPEERDNIVRKLKGKSTYRFKQQHGITEPLNLWAQKYHAQPITTDAQLHNTMHYVTHNRDKHQFPENKGVQPLVAAMLTSPDSPGLFDATFKEGGFDVVIGNPPYVRQEALGDLKTMLKKYEAYHGSADLFVYFVELGVKLLKKRGVFSYIVANKWMRANYGKPLRQWLKKQQLLQIIDYGDLPVFETATTYPCILFVSKDKPSDNVQVVKMEELAFYNLSGYVEKHGYTQPQRELDDNGWSLASENTQKVLEKINKVGVPLAQYVDGKIYRGVLTGLNEAFVIDEATKNKLIAEDPKSAEVIKPFLAGKEIKRYQPFKGKNHLIFFPNGWTNEQSGTASDKWTWLQKRYPEVTKYLQPFAERAKKRYDQGEHWWELRSCAYYDEFEKQKILYAEIAQIGQFILDKSNSYCDTTGFILGSDSKYLLGILSSQLWTFLFKAVSSEIQGGFLRWKRQYMAPLPIRTINFSDPADKQKHDAVVELVETMLSLHEQAVTADPSERARLEQEIAATDEQIDRLVYGLYELTEEEIRIVEEAVAR